MLCNNFVCAFSDTKNGKIVCTYNSISDCDINRQMSCKYFKPHTCKWCGHENRCFQQRDRGVFYSPNKGIFVPSVSVVFAEKAMQNYLINAKQDIFNTSCNNYRQGYKITTTVNQLYEKYHKQFPQFTKEFLSTAVHKSILKYLQTQ